MLFKLNLVGDYCLDLCEEIGKGANGTVYKCSHKSNPQMMNFCAKVSKILFIKVMLLNRESKMELDNEIKILNAIKEKAKGCSNLV